MSVLEKSIKKVMKMLLYSLRINARLFCWVASFGIGENENGHGRCFSWAVRKGLCLL